MAQKAYIIHSNLATGVGQQYQYPSQHGPFKNGTDIFTVIERTVLSGNPINYWAAVYLSAGGTSSIEQDSANAPQLSTDNSGFGVARLGTTLYLAYPNVANKGLSVKTFDLVSKTYGAAINNTDTTQINLAAAGVLANGDLLIQIQPEGTDAIWFTKLSGGVFSAYVVLSTHGDVGSIITIGNIGHIFYGDFANPPQIQYRSYSGATLSGATATGAVGLAAARLAIMAGIYLTGRDELLIPYQQQSNNGPLGLLRGTPSAAPVWTFSILVNTPSTNNYAFIQTPAICANANESLLYFAWRLDNASSGTATTCQILFITQTNGTGAWSGSTVYYDFYANPPFNSTLYVKTNPATDPATPPAGHYIIIEEQDGVATGINTAAMSIAVLTGDNPSGIPFSAVFAATTVFNPDASYYGDPPHLLTTVSVPPGSIGPQRGYVFELEKGVGRVATWQET